MTFRAIIVGAILGVAPWAGVDRVWADAPILSDGEDRIDARNGAFFAIPSPDRRSTVTYRVVRGRKAERMWTLAGWHPGAFLSDDGEYLVVGYPGVNLLALDHEPDVVMLSFFHRAKAVGVVRLNEIIQDRAHLRRTVRRPPRIRRRHHRKSSSGLRRHERRPNHRH